MTNGYSAASFRGKSTGSKHSISRRNTKLAKLKRIINTREASVRKLFSQGFSVRLTVSAYIKKLSRGGSMPKRRRAGEREVVKK